MLTKRTLFFLAILFNYHLLNAQERQVQNLSKYSLHLTVGYMYRTPAFDGGNSHLVVNRSIMNFPKNTSGFGANLGIEAEIRPLQLSFNYAPTIRYDYLYNKETAPLQYDEEQYNWLFEHNFSVLKYLNVGFPVRRGEKPKKRIYFGVGHSILNTGKSISYSYNFTTIQKDLQFSAVSGLVGVPIWRIYLEPKVMIANSYPYKSSNGLHWFLSLRTYYKFLIL